MSVSDASGMLVSDEHMLESCLRITTKIFKKCKPCSQSITLVGSNKTHPTNVQEWAKTTLSGLAVTRFDSDRILFVSGQKTESCVTRTELTCSPEVIG